jgi:hypothetical protein
VGGGGRTVFEALPFGVGEEVAPFGVAVGDCFVGAEGLSLCWGLVVGWVLG